jgi:hypothetical protein
MRIEALSEMDRTYTKKSNEKHFLDRITDHNYQNCGPQKLGFALWNRVVKKTNKLRTVIIGAGSANLRFESSYSLKLKEDCTP